MRNRNMSVVMTCVLLLIGLAPDAAMSASRGVSPYLPLNMSPAMDRKIDRVLLLGDKPIVRRPIAAALVLEALPQACNYDKALCEEVRAYLRLYMRKVGLTHLQLSGAATDGESETAVPNAHGLDVDDSWEARVRAYYQPNDYLLVSVGAIAREDETVATDSVLSLGFDFAQLDVGFRDHWLSPMSDSSPLISTQAPTMPSVTLSSYVPISPLGITYEVFVAQMSNQEGIVYFDETTSGHPRLAGLQAGIQPAAGYFFGLNRVMQYGGGARGGGSLSQFIDALFTNSNRPDVAGESTEFGNQVAAISSSMLFPGRNPFAVHFEYAGEDNAYAGNTRLGATNLSLGIDLPKVWSHYDFSYEISEWQNSWYVHGLYPRGLTNRGHVIGHWFGDERQFGDAIGGRSQMLRAGWSGWSGLYWQATYRTSTLDPAWRAGPSSIVYERAQALTLNVATAWHGRALNAELHVGRDIFGDSFARFQASVDFAETAIGSAIGSLGLANSASREDSITDVFIEAGANYSSVYKIFGVGIPNVRTDSQADLHIGFGARRRVSERSYLGVRVEADRVDERNLLSVRALDYSYRWNRRFALNGFFGAGRYDFGLPAYGYYWGAGLRFIDVLPRWDVGLDFRHHEKLGRDKTLPNDPPATPERTRLFFDVDGVALYVSRRL